MPRRRRNAPDRPREGGGSAAGRAAAERAAAERAAADRALFERALANLDASGPEGPGDRESAGEAENERRARFSRRVARGEVEPAARLDLHGLDRATAVDRLRRFLAAALPGEAVLVIHGKGRGILEAAVRAELEGNPRVAEHLTAPRGLGGTGARLVRLRSGR
jgi:DNA-nicking Smr family endonuclease